jgi:hypothetical protein
MPPEAPELSKEPQPNHDLAMSNSESLDFESRAVKEATKLPASAMLQSNANAGDLVACPDPLSLPARAKTIGPAYYEMIETDPSEDSSDIEGCCDSDTGSSRTGASATESSEQPSPVPPKSCPELDQAYSSSVLPPTSTHGSGEAFSSSPLVYPSSGLEIDGEPPTDVSLPQAPYFLCILTAYQGSSKPAQPRFVGRQKPADRP